MLGISDTPGGSHGSTRWSQETGLGDNASTDGLRETSHTGTRGEAGGLANDSNREPHRRVCQTLKNRRLLARSCGCRDLAPKHWYYCYQHKCIRSNSRMQSIKSPLSHGNVAAGAEAHAVPRPRVAFAHRRVSPAAMERHKAFIPSYESAGTRPGGARALTRPQSARVARPAPRWRSAAKFSSFRSSPEPRPSFRAIRVRRTQQQGPHAECINPNTAQGFRELHRAAHDRMVRETPHRRKIDNQPRARSCNRHRRKPHSIGALRPSVGVFCLQICDGVACGQQNGLRIFDERTHAFNADSW